MSLQFSIQNNDGVTTDLGVNDLVQQLQGQGYQVKGVSADGSAIKLVDDKGEYDVAPQDVLQDLGWKVAAVNPVDADYSNINKDWRQAVTVLPADDHKRAYLEGQFKQAGIPDAKIVGSGRDWFVFDPEMNKYVALTNNPDWDMSDASEALVSAPRIAGSMLGGAAGAIAGGGLNPLTGALGAGAGGALGDAGTRLFMAQRDPQLKQIMTDDLGAMAKDVGVNALYDAGAQGLMLGAPKVIGSLLGPQAAKSAQTMAQSGPLSTVARKLGGMAEEGGRIVNKVTRVADTGFGREVASLGIPGAAEAVTLGTIGQLPSQAVRGAARGLGWTGQRQALQKAAPEAAEWMTKTSKNLLRPSHGPSNFSNELSALADKGSTLLSGAKPSMAKVGGRTEDVLGNLGEMIGGGNPARDVMKRAYKEAREYGISAVDAKKLAEQAAEEALPESAKMTRNLMRKAGRGLQNIENFSRGVESTGKAVTGGILKGARAGSYVAGKGGSIVKNTAKLTQPLENRAYLRYGSEELYRPDISPSESWQDRRKRDKLGVILAGE